MFRSTRVVTGTGERPASVHVGGGRIQRIGELDEVTAGAELLDCGDAAILPGFVDSHVHINEPGRAEWEGFESATRAAAAGGVTTVVDMPLNSVPATTTAAALEEKLHAADAGISVDVAFWGGVVPDNRGALRALHDAGVVGFKCFLAPSGVPEFEHVSIDEMAAALGVLAELDSPLLVHAEDPALLQQASVGATSDYYKYAGTRPAEAELSAVRAVLESAARTGGRVHIVHASAAETVTHVAAARVRGTRVTVETCPHYLWFEAAAVPEGGTHWKCAPPIRDAAQRSGLRAALRSQLIDLVVSDHSPAPPELKSAASGDFLAAWGGIASLQIAPLVTWTVARELGCGLGELATWTSAAPARLCGLQARKGAIAPGMDADLVVLEPDAEVTIDAAHLHHRHKLTPYDGAALRGRVLQTWLRGELIYDRGDFPSELRGRALLRGRR